MGRRKGERREKEREEEGPGRGRDGEKEGEKRRRREGRKEELNWVKIKGVKLQVGAHHTEFVAVV